MLRASGASSNHRHQDAPRPCAHGPRSVADCAHSTNDRRSPPARIPTREWEAPGRAAPVTGLHRRRAPPELDATLRLSAHQPHEIPAGDGLPPQPLVLYDMASAPRRHTREPALLLILTVVPADPLPST